MKNYIIARNVFGHACYATNTNPMDDTGMRDLALVITGYRNAVKMRNTLNKNIYPDVRRIACPYIIIESL